MSERRDLRLSRGWRVAVWGLRMMAPGLVVVAVGLTTLIWERTVGQTALAIGMIVYLAGVITAVVGIASVYLRSRPSPNFIWLRWSLLHDATHPMPAGQSDFPGASVETYVLRLRDDRHWRKAVWAARATAPGLATMVAGLIALSISTAAGSVILGVGAAIQVGATAVSLIEVHRVYAGLPVPKPSYASVRQTLVHDAANFGPGPS